MTRHVSFPQTPSLLSAAGATVPPHLAGTRAALFHLLKSGPRPPASPRNLFRQAEPASLAQAAPPRPAPVTARPVPSICADILSEDVFEFHPLRA